MKCNNNKCKSNKFNTKYENSKPAAWVCRECGAVIPRQTVKKKKSKEETIDSEG